MTQQPKEEDYGGNSRRISNFVLTGKEVYDYL